MSRTASSACATSFTSMNSIVSGTRDSSSIVNPVPCDRTGSNSGLCAVFGIGAKLKRKKLEILQRFASYFDSFLFRFKKGRIAEAKLAVQALIGYREDGAGFLAAHLRDGEKGRSDHVDARNVLFVQLLNQFRRLLEQRVGRKDPAEMIARL